MKHSPGNCRNPPLFPKLRVSRARGPRSPPMMTKHDGLPRHPTPEELRIAQGEVLSGSKDISGRCLSQAKQYSVAPAPLSPGGNLATRPSEKASKGVHHGDDIALLGPQNGAGYSYSNSTPPWTRETLVQDKAPLFTDNTRQAKQARTNRDAADCNLVWQHPTKGVYELPVASPEPSPANGTKPAPESASHLQESPSNGCSEMGEGDTNDSEFFLGSGPPLRVRDITIDRTINTTPTSPTPASRRNDSLPTCTLGLLNLHDARNEVLLLLDKLLSLQDTAKVNEKESMYQSGRVSALEDVQEKLLRRSELSHIGAAEGRILRREAAKLDGMRHKARKEGPKAIERSKGLEDTTVIAGKLHEAVVRLFDEAHGALQTVEKMTGQTTSIRMFSGTPGDAVTQTANYPAWEDHHLVSLTNERRVLQSQIERLEKEKEKQREDMSKLRKQLDLLQARRSASIIPQRDVPHSLVPGPPVPLLCLQPVQKETFDAQRASAPWSFAYGSE